MIITLRDFMPPSPDTHPLDGLAERGVSPSTARVYRSAWDAFARWCEVESRRRGHEVSPLPARPETVRDYLLSEAPGKAYSSLRRARRAIELAHELLGLDNPLDDELVTEAWEGLLDEGSPLHEAPPIGREGTVSMDEVIHPDIHRMIGALPESIVGVRDKALLLVGAAGGLTRPELVALQVQDVEVHETRTVIRVHSDGAERIVEVQDSGEFSLQDALRTWLEASQVTEGPLFRPLRRGGHVVERFLTPQSLTLIVRRAAERAGLPREAASTEPFTYSREGGGK